MRVLCSVPLKAVNPDTGSEYWFSAGFDTGAGGKNERAQ